MALKIYNFYKINEQKVKQEKTSKFHSFSDCMRGKIMFQKSFSLLRKESFVNVYMVNSYLITQLQSFFFLASFRDCMYDYISAEGHEVWPYVVLGSESGLSVTSSKVPLLGHCSYDWRYDALQNRSSYLFCLSPHFSWLNICVSFTHAGVKSFPYADFPHWNSLSWWIHQKLIAAYWVCINLFKMPG